MGKKRVTAASLTKTYASGTNASTSAASSRSTLSVVDKLSKLRLEGLQHERNVTGTATAGAADSARASTPMDPEVSHLLGQHYVEPLTRVKARNRGHLAPKSWSSHDTLKHSTSRAHKSHDALQVLAFPSSLVDHCLHHLSNNIHDYLDCGMGHLPGYLKARLLESLHGAHDEVVWRDIVPEEDDEISALELTMTRPSIVCLKRMTGLRSVVMNASQVESALVPAISSVLQELTICPVETASTTTPPQKAYWRRLSSHFVALRCITLDFKYFDLASRHGLDTLLGVLLEGPDWRESFETVREINFRVSSEQDVCLLASALPYLAFKGSLRRLRRKGRHVECCIALRCGDA